MFKLVLAGTVMILASAAYINQKSPMSVKSSSQQHLSFAHRNENPINEEIVSKIRDLTDAWEPYTVEENPLASLKREELFALFDTSKPQRFEQFVAEQGQNEAQIVLPASFDPRAEKFQKCIHPIRSQGSCGSCWAFSSTEALSDRFCIAGTDVILSPQDMVSCATKQLGCNGGYTKENWKYLTNTGAVADACMTYVSGPTQMVPICPTNQTCEDGSQYRKYQCKANSTVNPRTITGMKTELFTNGPMQAAFDVYQDFMNYKKGVYKYVTGKYLGGHAIKVIGWGNEEGLDYWLIANSWGKFWAMDGFFKIKMGDSNIEREFYACLPQV